MKNINNLKWDLYSFPTKMKLEALEDGAFLADYNVTEEEVEVLYSEWKKENETFRCMCCQRVLNRRAMRKRIWHRVTCGVCPKCAVNLKKPKNK